MKVFKNTLYVQTEKTHLHKEGMNIVAKVQNKETARIPIHTLNGIVCFGHVYMTPPLMAYCAEEGVSVTFLTEHGRFQARIEGPVRGNVLLRKAQYRCADNVTRCLQLGSRFLLGKLHNQRAVVRRFVRDHGDTLKASAQTDLRRFDSNATAAIDVVARDKAGDLNEVRGVEGSVARAYFDTFQYLILAHGFAFKGRSRRPPLDPVNCLLSFIYVLLTRDISGAMESFGLDCQAGFLHSDRPGRPSLALDMLEEFRPCFADRLALSMINRRQLVQKDFITLKSGAVQLTKQGRRLVLVGYQEKKRRELKHPFTGEKEKFGNMWFVQAQLLARSLRGDLESYPPFLWK